MNQQRDMFTKRWRKVRAPDPSELQIHISLIARLGIMAMPGCVYFHVPNGELRDKRAAAKLKAMGELPGVADLQFIYNDTRGQLRILFLELKARGRHATPLQLEFERRVRALGCTYEIASSIDNACQILEKYGVLRRNRL
jgi:hypothetical protein